MVFDPVTLLTMSVVAPFAVGGLLIRASSREADRGMLRWTGAAILCLGLGLALLLAAPTDIHAPVRNIGNAVTLLASGLLWAAARAFNRRKVSLEIVVAGMLAWLFLVSVSDPSLAWRIGVASTLVAGYGAATAWEHRAGDAVTVPSGRFAGRVFACHGLFFLCRALLALAFGFAVSGAVIEFEAVLTAVLLGAASIAMARERAADASRRDGLEDPLTGIGNHGALFRSGGPLLDAMRRSNRATAVLLMDLDGFKAVTDLHGRSAGDDLLVAFARLAHDYLPPTSLVCRIGGEAFAAVLPGADAGRARAVADEIRALFAHLTITGQRGRVRATVSIGIAVDDGRPMDHDTPEVDPVSDGSAHRLSALLTRAERCLSAAKETGGNQVVAENVLPPSSRAAA